MSRKSLYNSKMHVKRLNLTGQDVVGGITQIRTTVFQYACRIRQLGADERVVGGKDGVVSDHRIYSKNIDIQNGDEIIINKKVYGVNTINPISAHKGTMEIDVTLQV